MVPALLSTATRYFMEVVRTGSVSEAAKVVHVAPSAISRQVAKLEESLGCVLFERQPRGMVLTEAGERLAAWVHGTQQDTERVADEVRGLAGQRASRVEVACTEGFAPGFMPEAMVSFRAAHPGTRIHLRVGAPDDVSRWLLRGEAELGLKFAVAPEKDLRIEHSRAAPIVALLAPAHPLARAKRLTLQDVLRHPLALPDSGTTVRQALDLACGQLGLHYEAVYAGNFPALLGLAAHGEVVTFASALAAAHEVQAGRLRALPLAHPQFEQRRVQLLSLAGRQLGPAAQGFARHLMQRLDASATHGRTSSASPRRSPSPARPAAPPSRARPAR
jgi:DNA-binding transcriptional LysR family regulator